MRNHPLISSLFTTTTTTMPPSSTKPHHRKPLSTTSNHHHSPPATATATFDLLILILVLISFTFLITSSFSYIFTSLSLLLPSYPLHFPLSYLLLALLLLSLALVVASLDLCFSFRSRKCSNPKCKGLKKALEFDLQLQTQDSLKHGNSDVDSLPWKGGTQSNPHYDCLRAELRKMAPPNGRAVLLFRAKCGCPVSKLVAWGPKKGRKHKKALSSVTVNGDHR